MITFAEKCRRESAASIAAGNGPTLRVAAPGAAPGTAPPIFYTTTQKGSLVVVGGATGRTLADAQNSIRSGSPIVFADATALHAAIRLWTQEDKWGAKRIENVTKLPINRFVVVLTHALANKYWAPSIHRDWRKWASWVGLGPNDDNSIESLYSMAIASHSHRSPTFVVDDLTVMNARSDTEAFYTSVAIADRRHFVLRTDAIARHEYVDSGESVQMAEVVDKVGLLQFKILSPCKLKSGDVTLFGESEKATKVKLEALSFDGQLHGEITFNANNKTAFRLATCGETLWLTGPEPFGGRKSAARRWTNQSDPAEPVGRPVPMHIALAAAVTD